jgi:hypothetical protein
MKKLTAAQLKALEILSDGRRHPTTTHSFGSYVGGLTATSLVKLGLARFAWNEPSYEYGHVLITDAGRAVLAARGK